MADERARLIAVIDKMRADGASHEQIVEFVNQAKAQRGAGRADALLGPKEPPYWTREDPAANDYPDKPKEPWRYEALKRGDDRGRHSMTPEEERTMNSGMAGLLAGVAIPGLIEAAPAAGLIGRAASTGLGRLATSALGGAASGEAEAGTRAAQEGKSAREVLEAAGDAGETGAKWGGALHLGGEVAGAVSGLLRKGKGLVSRYLRAKDAAAYEDPAMLALPGKEEGVQKAAEIGHGRVVARDAALERQAGQDYQGALNPPGPRPAHRSPVSREAAILDSMPDRPEQNALLDAARGVDAPPLTPPTAREQLLGAARRVDAPGAEPHTPGGYEPKPNMVEQEPWPREGMQREVSREKQLATLERERAKNINPDTKQPYDDAIDARFQRAIDALGPEGTVNTIEGTLGQRRALRNQANFGAPAATPDQMAARTVYRAKRTAIRDAAPDVAAADDAYAAHARGASRRRDILYRSESPVTTGPRPGEQAPDAEFADGPQGAAADLAGDPEMRVAKEQAGTRMLKREGDTNEPGLNAQKFLDELRAQDPEFANALDFIGNKKALEGTRFGAPHLPTNLSDATAHVGSVPVRYIRQNLRATARPLDAAMSAGERLKLAAPFSGAVANPLFEANENKKRRKKGH